MKYTPKEPPSDEINAPKLTTKELTFNVFSVLILILSAFLAVNYLASPFFTLITPLSVENKIGFYMQKTFKKVSANKEQTNLFEKFLKNNKSNVKIHLVKMNTENAFVIPGNKIFISQKLLDQADLEEEVFFVLAHELGHLKYKHALRSFYSSILIKIIKGIMVADSGALGFLFNATHLSFSRKQESKADEFALDYLVKNKFSLKGSLNFFKRQSKQRLIEKVELGGGYFSTHPISKKRINHLKNYCNLKHNSESCLF